MAVNFSLYDTNAQADVDIMIDEFNIILPLEKIVRLILIWFLKINFV